MRDRPDGTILLAMADATAESEDHALIAQARAIAAREKAAGEAPIEACRAALAALYGEDGDLDPLLRRLARDIRAGRYDAPSPACDRVCCLLWMMTRQKLSESNPDYLHAAGVG